MSFGKHTTEPKHKQVKPRFWTARWSAHEAPEWVTPIMKCIIATTAVIKGIDLMLDPTTTSEVFAYANLFGTDSWGAVQAATGALVLIFLTTRLRAGLIISLGLCMVVWGMYASVIAQAVLPNIMMEGGLRNIAGPGGHAAMFILAFMVSVRQYRTAATEGAGL